MPLPKARHVASLTGCKLLEAGDRSSLQNRALHMANSWYLIDFMQKYTHVHTHRNTCTHQECTHTPGIHAHTMHTRTPVFAHPPGQRASPSGAAPLLLTSTLPWPICPSCLRQPPPQPIPPTSSPQVTTAPTSTGASSPRIPLPPAPPAPDPWAALLWPHGTPNPSS